MKANELMICDYVLVKPSMMLIKVAAVHHKKVGYHAVTHRLNWVRIDLLEPVPLTEKILEMNGFTHNVTAPCGYYNASVYDMHDVLFHVSGDTYEDTWHTEVFIDHNDNEYVLFNLCYVHELQRVLKQCGLNDLANNLKLEK